MKQIKILAIGNSFSEDATHYLHQIAKADEIDTKVVNLYIGGCPIEKHCRNIENDEKAYLYQRDGKATEKYISIKEALQEEEWDFVITQQASCDSGIEETYYPYIHELFEYIKEYAPKAERLLQQTWAYETDSTHDCFVRYNNDQKEMYEKLCEAYSGAAAKVGVRIIPCGDVVQAAREKKPYIYAEGGMSLCRDGFHMHYIYGRYLLAATWYEIIFNKNIMDNTYIPETIFAPDAVVDAEALNVIKRCVHEVLASNNF